MHLYIIRHGQSFVNLPDWKAPSRADLDAGLTPLGERQAQALATWLGSNLPKINVLYASTMRRARETAQYVAQTYQCDIHFDDRIREASNNRRSGEPFPSDALPTKHSNVPAMENPFINLSPDEPDGESFTRFRARTGEFLFELLDKHIGERVVVVTHGGVLNALADNIFNVGLHRQVDLWEENTGITYFEWLEKPIYARWRLHFMSKTEHLMGIS